MDGNDRRIAAFTSLGHASFHTYELSIPVFVAIWLDAFSASPALLGTVVAVGYGLIGLCAPVSGVLSDTYGSKRLVLGSLAGMAGGFLVLAISPSVIAVGAALVVWGVAASLYHPAGLSMISRGASSLGPTLAYHGAAGNVGTALGPLLTVVLLAAFDWRLVAAVLVVPAAGAALWGLRIDFEEGAAVADGGGPRDAASGDGGAFDGETGRTEPSDDATRGLDLRGVLGDTLATFRGAFLVVFVLYMLYGVYYRGALTFLPEVLSGLSQFPTAELFGRPVEPGRYVYSGLLMVGVLGQYVGGRLSEAVSLERAIVGVFALLAIASAAFVPASAAGLAPLLFVCAAVGFAVYVFVPLGQAMIADAAPADVHGLTYGYTYLGFFGVGALGASASGVVIEYASVGALFLALAGLAAVGELLAGWLARRG